MYHTTFNNYTISDMNHMTFNNYTISDMNHKTFNNSFTYYLICSITAHNWWWCRMKLSAMVGECRTQHGLTIIVYTGGRETTVYYWRQCGRRRNDDRTGCNYETSLEGSWSSGMFQQSTWISTERFRWVVSHDKFKYLLSFRPRSYSTRGSFLVFWGIIVSAGLTVYDQSKSQRVLRGQ